MFVFMILVRSGWAHNILSFLGSNFRVLTPFVLSIRFTIDVNVSQLLACN